jgi:thioredoxin-related protein
MKKMITLLAVVGLSLGALGADGWLTDFEAAKKQATEKNLPILVDFSGSDWCGWCIKLDKEVFSKDEFKAYAKDNLVLFLADFPRTKQLQAEVKAQNEKLAKQYGVRGFPTVLLLDSKGETIVGRTGYEAGGPENYIEHLKGLLK